MVLAAQCIPFWYPCVFLISLCLVDFLSTYIYAVPGITYSQGYNIQIGFYPSLAMMIVSVVEVDYSK